MHTLIVESTVSEQTVKDALMRAAFNLRKFAMSDYDREQAAIVDALAKNISPPRRRRPMESPKRPELADMSAPATERPVSSPAEHPRAVHPTVKLADRKPVEDDDSIPPYLQPTTAPYLLRSALETIEERGKLYDKASKEERSIKAVVEAFNSVVGREGERKLTEPEGWLFMQLLKAVRLFSAPGFHADSALDGVAYAALTGEAKAREAGL